MEADGPGRLTGSSPTAEEGGKAGLGEDGGKSDIERAAEDEGEREERAAGLLGRVRFRPLGNTAQRPSVGVARF